MKVEAGENLLMMISSLKSGLDGEGVKWINPDNIHITLAFLGDTGDNSLKTISEMLRKYCEGKGKFELTIKGSGVFKSLNDPRVIWIGVEHSEKLEQLNNYVKMGLKDAGIKIENRPFNPHLTLGRIKFISNKPALKTVLEKYKDIEIQKISVEEVIIFESILLQSGPLYTPVGKIRL